MTSPLQRYNNIEEQLEALSKALWKVGRGIMESMERDGATEWVDGGFTATIKRKPNYIQRRLYPAVLELLSEAELIKSGALIPAHEEPVEATMNMTKFKPFAKRGKAIKALIEDAVDLGPPKLTVTKEEE